MVAFDFSARAIEIARSHAAHFSGNCPEFVQADICDPQLQKIAGQGQGFNFISCQGVASYVPDLPAALKQIRDCLSPKGFLYLGVNGSGHHSRRLRPLLSQIGVDPQSLETAGAEEKARAVLRMYEILTRRREGELSDESTAYIANDVFGPINRCLPLADWLEACRATGLHYRGSLGTARFMAETFRLELISPLLGLSKEGVAGFLDGLLSDVFHSLILTRGADPVPDFSALQSGDPVKSEAFMQWRPLVDLWSRQELGGVAPHDRILTMTLSIPGVHRRTSFDCPFGVVELLHHADGKASLRSLWRTLPRLNKLRPVDVAPYLFGLYHSSMLSFLPASSGSDS